MEKDSTEDAKESEVKDKCEEPKATPWKLNEIQQMKDEETKTIEYEGRPLDVTMIGIAALEKKRIICELAKTYGGTDSAEYRTDLIFAMLKARIKKIAGKEIGPTFWSTVDSDFADYMAWALMPEQMAMLTTGHTIVKK